MTEAGGESPDEKTRLGEKREKGDAKIWLAARGDTLIWKPSHCCEAGPGEELNERLATPKGLVALPGLRLAHDEQRYPGELPATIG
jgi:hypothetical protein